MDKTKVKKHLHLKPSETKYVAQMIDSGERCRWVAPDAIWEKNYQIGILPIEAEL